MHLIEAFIGNADSFVDKPAIFGLTWGHILLILFILSMGFLLVKFLSNPSRYEQDDDHSMGVYCPGCGWRGRVSRHKPICPNCQGEVERT